MRPVLRLLAALLALVGLLHARPARADQDATAKARGAPVARPAPVTGHPIRLLSVPGGEVLAQMADGSVRGLESREVVVAAPSAGQVRRAICDVRGIAEAEPEEKPEGEDDDEGGEKPEGDEKAEREGEEKAEAPAPSKRARPHVACIRVVASTGTNGQVSLTVELVDSESKGPPVGVASSNAEGSLDVLGIGIAGGGELSWGWTEVVTETVNGAQSQRVVPYLHHAGKDQEITDQLGGFVQGLADVGAGDRVPPAIQFVTIGDRLWMIRRAGGGLVAQEPGGTPHEVAASSLHDYRAVRADDGWVYVLFHDPTLSSAFVAASKDGVSWSTQLLDTRESGWQVDAAAYGDQVVSIHYFFRNSYHKGIRTVTFEGGRVKEPAVTIVREDRHNAGWHPHIGIDADGRTWITWLSHVEDDERTWSRFDRPADMRKGAIGSAGTWEDDYKDYYLQTGVGGWLTLWHLGELVPDPADVGGARLGATTYEVGASLLLTGSLEARYKWFNLGLSYAQSIVDDAAEKVEGSSGLLNGSIKLDEAFPGHDFKVEGIWGRYRGLATPGDEVIGDPLEISTDYVDLKALALNKWRIKYGLGYTTYAVPTTVHAYSALDGETAYTYQGSHLRDVRLHEIDLLIGYSKLDYAAKYENQYFGPIVDATLGFGLVFGSFDAIPTPAGDATDLFTFHFRGNVMAGLLFFQRFQSLRGFGFYVRPAYVAEGGLTGLAAQPGDREEPVGDAALGQISFWSVRHGPWLDAGLVW
jgi:hypothetical protein